MVEESGLGFRAYEVYHTHTRNKNKAKTKTKQRQTKQHKTSSMPSSHYALERQAVCCWAGCVASFNPLTLNNSELCLLLRLFLGVEELCLPIPGQLAPVGSFRDAAQAALSLKLVRALAIRKHSEGLRV